MISDVKRKSVDSEIARAQICLQRIAAALVHACRYCGLLDASDAAYRVARRLDPHAWTSVIYTWWFRDEAGRIVDETTDAHDFELRALALHRLGRTEEALRVLVEASGRPAPPIFELVSRSVLDFLRGAPEARVSLAETVAAHSDPEALVVYGQTQARVGDSEGALATLTAGVESGFAVPEAFDHPWLDALRGPRLDGLRARVEAGRARAGSPAIGFSIIA